MNTDQGRHSLPPLSAIHAMLPSTAGGRHDGTKFCICGGARPATAEPMSGNGDARAGGEAIA
ncbi:hypothetical protein BG36_00860 [Aquamicrobium defluvii]|uniref:Uncharacterized protein n=1 Tax=Aquamicrobium defluvii TaxID=69279 RepID=A0A011UWL9_9HYPH|nr:hypothetical protein BG36_00860 [Aquamicrobium defluvii]EZQ17813.1 hypothetical protein CF98_32480 [Halopseudomonas bauzanensis]